MTTKKIFVIDIDGTICFPGESFETHARYADAKPNWPIIWRIRQLHTDGHTIILHTARRMVTHKNDVAKVIADVGQVTIDWLTKYNVPYHELVFGKPYGDCYVDDKACSLDGFLTD